MELIKSGFYWIINLVINVIVTIVDFILNILPKIPFEIKPLKWGPFADFVGVFLPSRLMIVHFTALTMVLLTYFAGRYILKLIRMVG